MKMRYNVNGDGRWYLSVYPETPKTVAVDYAYSAGNADTVDNYHAGSFGIWRGTIQTDPEADDSTYTSTSSFLSLFFLF